MSSLRARLSPASLSPASLAWVAIAWVAIAWVAIAWTSPRAFAHIPAHGVGTVTTIEIHPDRIALVIDLSYTNLWAQGEMISMDANKSSVVETGEADRYMAAQWKLRILPRAKLTLDGEALELELVKSEHEGLIGEIYPGPFSLYYTVEARPSRPLTPGQMYRLVFDDAIVRGETPGKPRFAVARASPA